MLTRLTRYNSLVFVSLSSNNYYWSVVDESFLSGAYYNLTGPLSYSVGMRSNYFIIPGTPDGTYDGGKFAYLPEYQPEVDQLYAFYDEMQRNASSWDRLTPAECLEAYSNVFVTGRRNVVLVTSNKNETDSLFTYDQSMFGAADLSSNWWICSKTINDGGNMFCNPEKVDSDTWEVYENPIEYCLSEPVEAICEVKFSLAIMAVVIVFNVLKVLAMTWVLWRYDAENILTTVGDAAASFLLREDATTRGMCLADRSTIERMWKMPGTGVPYTNRRSRWAGAVSKGKWWLFSLLMFASFALIFFFGTWGFYHLNKKRGVSLDFASLWRLGFGAPHQDAIVLYDISELNFIGMAMLANIPQIFLAAVWLLYMGIMTSMFLAADWATFGTSGHTLQVSSPAGRQRGSWLLGAPPSYGVFLLVLQMVLHWLVSQSIFVISVSFRTPDGSVPTRSPSGFVNAGFSPVGIIFSVIVSGLLVLSVIVMAMRRMPLGAPPVVATCSAAISAACHMPSGMDSMGLVYERLRWGQNGDVVHGVAHCSLMPETAFETGAGQPPTVGWHYAGLLLEHDHDR